MTLALAALLVVHLAVVEPFGGLLFDRLGRLDEVLDQARRLPALRATRVPLERPYRWAILLWWKQFVAVWKFQVS